MKIQIKRGAASGLDSLSLSEGELAAVLDTGDLYVGTDNNGGKKQVNRRKCVYYASDRNVGDMSEGVGRATTVMTNLMSATPAVGDWLIAKDSNSRLCLFEVTRVGAAMSNVTLVWQVDLSADGIVSLLGYTPAKADDVTSGLSNKMSKSQILDMFYPVGTIYQTDDRSFNPAKTWGGKWEQISGRFLYGAASTEDVRHKGGSAYHTLTAEEMPKHSHPIYINNEGGETITPSAGDYLVSDKAITSSKKTMWATLATDSAGGGKEFGIMPPYYVVMTWRRTG